MDAVLTTLIRLSSSRWKTMMLLRYTKNNPEVALKDNQEEAFRLSLTVAYELGGQRSGLIAKWNFIFSSIV